MFWSLTVFRFFFKNWYRGLVQAMTADKKMAHVLYIDFGNEEYVPLGRIRQLATNIQSFCPCVSKYLFKKS